MSGFEAQYGRTADGYLAARTGDLAYIAVPVAKGLRIASGWRIGRPIAQWRLGDACGSEGIAADEDGFRAHVAAIAAHLCQREVLNRKETRIAKATPWGASHGATVYAEGVVFHSTASHGGFKLDRARNAAMPPLLRLKGGWYEEDAEWAMVAAAFPALFTERENALADRTLKNSWPDVWEGLNGRTLAPGESQARDRELFEREHAADWIAVAAVQSYRHAGMVEATATVGGRREGGQMRHFLVPAAEYTPGPHGFVINLERHVAAET